MAAWRIGARAQQGAKIPRIGIVDDAPIWQTLRQALRELGYVHCHLAHRKCDLLHIRWAQNHGFIPVTLGQAAMSTALLTAMVTWDFRQF